jgi:anoctamin-10
MEERVFLDSVREEEVALPEYDLIADYSEMVI